MEITVLTIAKLLQYVNSHKASVFLMDWASTLQRQLTGCSGFGTDGLEILAESPHMCANLISLDVGGRGTFAEQTAHFPAPRPSPPAHEYIAVTNLPRNDLRPKFVSCPNLL